MARYSRRRGPPDNLGLSAAYAEISELTITRFFDDGELLVAWRVVHLNGAAVAGLFEDDLQVDGISVTTVAPGRTIPSAHFGTLSDTILVPVTAGPHTIKLRARSSAGAGTTVEANGSHLTVVQLPQWDAPGDLL